MTGSRLHSTITTDLTDSTLPYEQQPPRYSHEDQVAPPSPPGPPSAVPTQGHTTPFAGPLWGCTWKSQAFFARNPWQHGARSSHALSLLSQHDFLALQETHSDEGRARIWTHPVDVTAFWSHAENQHTAGVGLLVKSSFLQQFSPTTDASWKTIAHGRAAALRLDGPLGSLDIYTVYLHSGQQRQARESLIRTLASFIRPRSESLSLSLSFSLSGRLEFCSGQHGTLQSNRRKMDRPDGHAGGCRFCTHLRQNAWLP